MAPEPTAPSSGGGSFLTTKYMGIPGIVWLGGAAILAYFLFFRNKSSSSQGSSSSGGGGTSSTGDITFTPPANRIQVGIPTANGQAAPVNTTSGSTSTEPGNNQGLNPGQANPVGTPNPQPTPTPPARTATTGTTVQHKAGPAPVKSAGSKTQTVTVTKWTATNTPWNSTLSGIAQHYNTTVAELLKLNPSITNPNLIYPGQKITVP
jgi:LysM repeat protein